MEYIGPYTLELKRQPDGSYEVTVAEQSVSLKRSPGKPAATTPMRGSIYYLLYNEQWEPREMLDNVAEEYRARIRMKADEMVKKGNIQEFGADDIPE